MSVDKHRSLAAGHFANTLSKNLRDFPVELLADLQADGFLPLYSQGVHGDGQVFVAGEVTRDDDFEEHREVSMALAQAISEGLFKPVSQQIYDYLISADSLASLLTWRKENAKRSVIDDHVIQEAERLVSAFAGSSTVVLRQPSRLSRLNRLARFDKV